MASYHLSVKTVKRSAGRSATAAAAYRSGSVITCEREGRVHDYSAKRGVQDCFILAPEGAPDWAQERAALWNAAEARENRSNSVTAREWELALPSELTDADRVALARDFAQALVARYGVVADVAVHAPHAEGDQRNHHVHILTTTRVMGSEGLGAKTRILDAAKTGGVEIEAMREVWAGLQNRALELAGTGERVDHRSLEAQREAALARGDDLAAEGLDRAPEVKLGPAVNAMERRAQREAAAEGRDYVPVTVRGAAVYSARKARALVAELRERVEELREAYALAREQGEGRIPAGLAALRALRAKSVAAEVEAGQVAGPGDIKMRLAGILQRDQGGAGKAVGQPSVPEPAIEARLPEVLGRRAVEEEVAPVARRNPRLIGALAQIAEGVVRREQLGFSSPAQARAFFDDLRESYGGNVLGQVASGDDHALVADFPDAELRRQVAIGMVVLGRSYGEIEREDLREVGPEIAREQDDGWEL
uniref:Putative plasmid mobilization protein MobA n=1 Tax=Paracoccus aminophilus JCM 7686 TaxID=1367847 RepID=E7BLE6_PARAH|nr:MobQ family relaxase [Paracoccus aminophilus]ADF47151.1 putative plasmid mobilization protein MobA [Paracoccus aminophilus JCM 7686]